MSAPKPWIAYCPPSSSGWWRVGRGGADGDGHAEVTFYNLDAQADAERHARLLNLADGIERHRAAIDQARAFIASAAIHAPPPAAAVTFRLLADLDALAADTRKATA